MLLNDENNVPFVYIAEYNIFVLTYSGYRLASVVQLTV